MSVVALRRRVTRLDHGGSYTRRLISQMTDAELQAAIEREVRKTDPAVADRLRHATEEERAQMHRQIAAGELP